MRASVVGTLLAIAVVVLGSSSAWAGGIEIPDNGTRSVGRGGAYAAAVAEPSALYYNPAALSLIDGPALTLNANLWFTSLTFQRDPYTAELLAGQTVTYPFAEAEDSVGIFPAPMLFAAWDFGLDNWGFGAGIYGPSAIGRRQYPAPDLETLSNIRTDDTSERDWGHGFLVEESDILLIYYSLAVAYDFGPVQLGLTLQLTHMITTFANGIDGDGSLDANQDSQEVPALYSRTVVEVSGFAPTGIFGVRVQPIDALTLALSYRPRIPITATGDLNVELPVAITDLVSLDGNDAELSLTLPDVIRFGVRWAFFDGEANQVADIELDFVYEAWSVTESFNVSTDAELAIDLLGERRAVPDIVIPRGYDDTMSFRLGGDVQVIDDLTLRAGAFLEGAANGEFFSQGASRPGFANIDFPSFQRTGVGTGASYAIGDFSIDLAYMHVFVGEVVEEDGQIPVLYPLWACNDPANDSERARCEARTTEPTHAVNNGRYNASYDLLSLGFSYNP